MITPSSFRRVVAALLCAMTLAGTGPVAASSASSASTMGPEARRVFEGVQQTWDNQGLPFMIIDKKRARLFVFDAEGRLQGQAPVLLGLAKGDHTVPGIGDKPLEQIRPEERTTPAGRFLAEVGMNARGEDVVWVDYDAAVSMHRVLKVDRRLQRLATPTVSDNRVSYGCINVPTTFFERVVNGTVRGGPSVVYVLPDVWPLGRVFGFIAPERAAAAR